jgi:hypothetical protein
VLQVKEGMSVVMMWDSCSSYSASKIKIKFEHLCELYLFVISHSFWDNQLVFGNFSLINLVSTAS